MKIQSRLLVAAGSLLALAALGCGGESGLLTSSLTSDVVAPSTGSHARASGVEGYYPLKVGNRWTYEYRSSKSFAPLHGDTISKQGTIHRELRVVGFEVVAGATYAREEIIFRELTQTIHSVNWVRQDRSGLFEPSYWFPGVGTGSYEIQRLSYPLHVGQTWIVDEQTGDVALVVAREMVRTPFGRAPAWKIRIDYGGRGPGHEVFVWYGDIGYLGLLRHFQYVHSGPNPITVTEDESEWIQSAELVPTPGSQN